MRKRLLTLTLALTMAVSLCANIWAADPGVAAAREFKLALQAKAEENWILFADITDMTDDQQPELAAVTIPKSQRNFGSGTPGEMVIWSYVGDTARAVSVTADPGESGMVHYTHKGTQKALCTDLQSVNASMPGLKYYGETFLNPDGTVDEVSIEWNATLLGEFDVNAQNPDFSSYHAKRLEKDGKYSEIPLSGYRHVTENYKTFGDPLVRAGAYSGHGATYQQVISKLDAIINSAGGFSDVPDSAYFAEPVRWAVEKGITKGKTASTFAPGDTCTRAQILTFLWRAQGSPEPTGSNPYGDVTKDRYFYQAAVWAYEQHLYDRRNFEGDTPCTRLETVIYMWKLAGSPDAPKVTFSDVSRLMENAKAIDWAVEQAITNGVTPTTFNPGATCTRGQIVTFLYRAYG